jgi:hypothetical protein
VSSYTPCDRQPRFPGCIKGDAERLCEAFDLSRFDAIDVDVYGSPWACWLAIAKRLTAPTLVFLTWGWVAIHGTGTQVSAAALGAMGVPEGWPAFRNPRLLAFAEDYCLWAGASLCPVAWVYRVRLFRVTYYALYCVPARP